MNARTTGSVLVYFLLSVALSLPFWLAGAFIDRQLLPALPFSALGFICMAAAAAILTCRESGRTGLKELLKRSFDFQKVKAKLWYLPTVLLMPLIMFLSFIVVRLMGTSIPLPQILGGKRIGLFVAFFVGALGEELGWSGYAIDPLQDRFGALRGGIFLGAVWAVIHFIPLLQAHRSLAFIAWWTVGTVANRVVMVWLYNNSGRSVFVATLYHATINLTWQLFPMNGSYYDPRVTETSFSTAILRLVWRAQSTRYTIRSC